MKLKDLMKKNEGGVNNAKYESEMFHIRKRLTRGISDMIQVSHQLPANQLGYVALLTMTEAVEKVVKLTLPDAQRVLKNKNK